MKWALECSRNNNYSSQSIRPIDLERMVLCAKANHFNFSVLNTWLSHCVLCLLGIKYIFDERFIYLCILSQVVITCVCLLGLFIRSLFLFGGVLLLLFLLLLCVRVFFSSLPCFIILFYFILFYLASHWRITMVSPWSISLLMSYIHAIPINADALTQKWKSKWFAPLGESQGGRGIEQYRTTAMCLLTKRADQVKWKSEACFTTSS